MICSLVFVFVLSYSNKLASSSHRIRNPVVIFKISILVKVFLYRISASKWLTRSRHSLFCADLCGKA